MVDCAWVDADGNWSTAGVTTGVEELEGGGATVRCVSTHLTLFGIVPKMNLASAEDLEVQTNSQHHR